MSDNLKKLIERARICRNTDQPFIWDNSWLNECETDLASLRAERDEMRESEPKKIKRLRALVDNLKLCNDRLQASLLEWGK